MLHAATLAWKEERRSIVDEEERVRYAAVVDAFAG